MSEPHIELIARGVLIHDGRILIARSRKGGYLFLPGGHVEFGEPAAAALEREMMEELGTPLLAREFLGASEAIFDQPSKSGNLKRHHEVNLLFRLEPPDPAIFDPAKLASQEQPLEFIWIPLSDIKDGSPSAPAILPPGILSLVTEQPKSYWHGIP